MQIRRTLRLAIHEVLADVSAGFNETLLNLSREYGTEPFTIDFGPDSRNLFFGFLPPQVDLSTIGEYPALIIYTTDAQNTHEFKPAMFSGTVIAHVDVWLRFNEGAEQFDTESVCEAVEDTIIQVFERDSAAWPVGVSYTGQYQGFWQPITQLVNGWERILPMEFIFQITS